MFLHRPTLFLLSLLASAWLTNETSAQSQCDPSELLLVVDRSSSMRHLLPDGMSKWQAAHDAVRVISEEFGSAELGIMVFPSPNRCGPGEIILEPSRYSPDVLVGALGSLPPRVGNHTPIAQTLASLIAHPGLSDHAHIVLITDGWQWCDPYDRSMRGASISVTRALREEGKTVHVVGFGSGVDAWTLGQTAVAGGAALDHCDVTRTGPTGRNHCYMQADDADSLVNALRRVAALAIEETCNGRDDDCDGRVDEGFDVDGDGYSRCDPVPDCDDTDPGIYPGAPETCDGVDHNCDGALARSCGCQPGDSRSCAIRVDRCTGGSQLCLAGRWGVCEGIPVREPERCDAIDNDCDGVIDEMASCSGGTQCRNGTCTAVLADSALFETASNLGDAGPDSARMPPLPSPSCFCRTSAGTGAIPYSSVLFGLAIWIRRRRTR